MVKLTISFTVLFSIYTKLREELIMKLKEVTTAETQIVMSILKETAEWLKDRGSNQWSEVLQGEDKHELAKAVEREEVFFFYNNENELVGMVAAWKKPTTWDKLLWAGYGLHPNSRYIHRVIIRPVYRGKGYGKELLSALKIRFEGEADMLRLDCLASNHKLVQFYGENEFTNIGSSMDSNGLEFELFSFYL
ncbi:hypothetical protein RV12_GL000650 [Enterococcus quebecensis]|nr:hypothetical protein RV12_GL000650 [Enterococcus quebecensis]